MTKIYAKRNIGAAEIQISIGDISKQPDMDAIVNASNSKLRMGSGVSGAIFYAAGIDKLNQACAPLAPIEVSNAVMTLGFNLPNRYIIHCCGPQYKENSGDEKKLSSCYRNVLTLAEKNKITSLAIPAISTGAFGFPIDEATRISINSIKEFSPNFDNLRTIRFVVVDKATAALYARYLQEDIPIPVGAVKVDFGAYFSQAQFLRIRRGFIGNQDDKWFFYFDDPWLYVFRGSRWFASKNCYFFIKFQSDGIGYKVSETWFDRFMLEEDGNERTNFLHFLIYDYLLGEDNYTNKSEFTPFTGSPSNAYYVLPSGRIKLAISSEPLFIDEVRNLGLQLIGLADNLNAKQLQEKIIYPSGRFRGALLGLACGDAVGTTVEFRQRGSFPLVTDMVGGGPFKLKAGEWTDDTSMALCLADSLIECNSFDAADQMQRYVRWFNEGYWSSNGICFDIGGTTHDALKNFIRTGNPFSGSTHAQSAGNGCIMRLAPVPMFFYPDRDKAIEMSGESSRTTHGAEECVEACRLFGSMLFLALGGASKVDILFGHGMTDFYSVGIRAIANGAYRSKPEYEIFGVGYVVPSLEAALWCFYHTDNFGDAILKATNLGQDSDTTAAICGQIAGAFYGETGIPESWRNKLAMRDEICSLSDQLFQLSLGATHKKSK